MSKLTVQSLAELLRFAPYQNPSETTFHDVNTAMSVTDLQALAQIYAGKLQALGIKPGQRVVVQLSKSCVQVAVYFAVWSVGAVLVPLHLTAKEVQVQHVLLDSQASLFLTEAARLGQLAATVKADIACLSVSDLTTLNEQAFTKTEITPDSLAALLYTSGSTGLAKGVMLSQQNLLLGAKSVAQYTGLNQSDVVLALLPFSFDYGLNQLLSALWAGAKVVLQDFLLVQDVIRQVERHQVSVIAAVPPLWRSIANGRWSAASAQSVKVLTNSGGAMPPSLLQELQNIFPAATPFLMYGLTEAFRASFLSPQKVVQKPHSVGQAIPYASLRIVRPDGSECDIEEAGELIQWGPLVAQGYWRDPDKTAQKFRLTDIDAEHGKVLAVWSGDEFKRDAEGDLYYVGRMDDMMKCSGYRISPTEVELACVRAIPELNEVVALAPSLNEVDQAILLIVSATVPLQIAQVRAALAPHLPPYALPKALVQLVELPKTVHGKLDRSLLKHSYKGFFIDGNAT